MDDYREQQIPRHAESLRVDIVYRVEVTRYRFSESACLLPRERKFATVQVIVFF